MTVEGTGKGTSKRAKVARGVGQLRGRKVDGEMDEKTIKITMPSDLYTELLSVPLMYGKMENKIQVFLAIGMFALKEVSLARAAEYAEMSLPDFSELLNNNGIPIIDYTDEMIEDDVKLANDLNGL